MGKIIGIDLGTTNSAICSYDGKETRIWKSPEQNDVTPSAISYDRRGNRLGRGRGFYDRLLHNATCPLIGAAYAIQIVEHIPAEPHDIKIPTIVTDEETIRIQQYGISNS